MHVKLAAGEITRGSTFKKAIKHRSKEMAVPSVTINKAIYLFTESFNPQNGPEMVYSRQWNGAVALFFPDVKT